MAAPIFKFKNVGVSLDTTNETRIYAVDIGRGKRGLDAGVLPEEVSTVILTVQCSNKRNFVSDKKIVGVDFGDNSFVLEPGQTTAGLVVNLPVVFNGEVFGGVVAGKTYYIKELSGNNKFKISQTITDGEAGEQFVLSDTSGEMMADFDTSVQVSAYVRDEKTLEGYALVENYNVIANNAFDPLNGNLVLTSNLGLYVKCSAKNAVDVVLSLLEIANATAT